MYVEFFLLNKKGKGHFSVGRKSKDQTFRFDARELCLTHGSSFYRPGYLRLLNWTSTVWKDLDLHFFPSEMPWIFFYQAQWKGEPCFQKGGVDSPLGPRRRIKYFHFPMMIRSLFEKKYRWCRNPAEPPWESCK